ncbi:MAG: hypothetical protein JWO06_2198 [Bacteroidota bacterium]|nr:hypothetical protein [Bacteroidota bacterium]
MIKVRGCVYLICFCSLLLLSAVTDRSIEKIKGFSHPSAICAVNGSLYITDIGKKVDMAAKDGDGAVVSLNVKQEIQNKNVVGGVGNTPINAPTGICTFNYKSNAGGFMMMRKSIAIADIDRIYAYELIYNSRFFYLDLSKETHSLGGIVSLNDSVLFVASTDKNCLFKININTKAYQKVPVAKIKGAKALCFDKDKKFLYCVGWGEANIANGEIWKINTQTLTAEKLGDDLGYLAGCAVYNNKLYYCDWVDTAEKKGVIRYMDLNTHAIKNVPCEAIGGPGGIFIDEASKTLFVPALLEGVIYSVPLD